MNQMDNSLGIYVHIPFCVKKCDYCDFLSAPAGEEAQLRYMEALREEIRMTAGEERPVDTIFFGGGTPSILPAEEIAKTLEVVHACFNVAEDAEITVECNPGTLTEEKCRIYRACGVNRLSIGLQSADNRLLKNIGRIHTYEEFLESYEAARRSGFMNINIDLMSGLPGQSVQDHVDTLGRILALQPEHISAYSLILEEGTPLYERVQGEFNAEDRQRMEDEEMEMYVKTREILEAHGYHRYEISNYSLPGRECRHNLRYWNLQDYCGFGIGAASFADGCRYKNTDDLEKYVEILQTGSCMGSRISAGIMAAAADVQILLPEPGAGNQTTESIGKAAEEEKKQEKANRLKMEETEKDPGFHRLEELRAEFTRETDRELMEEFVFLGLRKTEGIRTEEFADRFGQKFDAVYGSVRKKLTAQGFLKEAAGVSRISLTDRGIDFSNEVLAEFLQS